MEHVGLSSGAWRVRLGCPAAPAGCPLLPPPRSPLLPWTLRAAGGAPELYLGGRVGDDWGRGRLGGRACTCWPLGPKHVVWPLSTRGGQRGPTLVQGSDSRPQDSVSLSPKWGDPSLCQRGQPGESCRCGQCGDTCCRTACGLRDHTAPALCPASAVGSYGHFCSQTQLLAQSPLQP